MTSSKAASVAIGAGANRQTSVLRCASRHPCDKKPIRKHAFSRPPEELGRRVPEDLSLETRYARADRATVVTSPQNVGRVGSWVLCYHVNRDKWFTKGARVFHVTIDRSGFSKDHTRAVRGLLRLRETEFRSRPSTLPTVRARIT